MATSLKRLLVGNPLKTEQAAHERLSKKTALAVFSSDALSSTAYATEEILLVLAAAVAFGQAGAFHYVVPISVGIALLLVEGLGRLHEIRNTVIVPVSGIHRGVINALQYARSISPDGVKAVYVDFDEEATARLREKWERWGSGVELVVLASPHRELTRPLLRYVGRLWRRGDHNFVTVVLPEFVPARWWQQLLHNQSSLLLKGSLLFKKGVVVTSVPYHLEH